MGDFRVDLKKLSAIASGGRSPGLREWAVLWILNSELHCVAAYRWGRLADAVHVRHPLAGLPLVISHRVWNRWNTTLHHCDIDRRANIGPGLLIMHRHGVLIGPVVIGANGVIHHNVTIGQRVGGGDQGVPRIGRNVWIGPAATITGAITIGDGATISAGAVVSRDIPPRSLVAGNPGRVIASDYDNSSMINFHMPGPVGETALE